MEVFYDNDDAGLKEAALWVSDNWNNDALWDEFLSLGPFTHTEVNVEEIVGYMRSCPNNIEVQHFTPTTQRDKKKYKKTVAYVTSGSPFKVFYHTKFLNRTVSQKVDTIVHEFVHLVDLFCDGSGSWDYGHERFLGGSRLKSAPYMIGRAAGRVHNGGRKRGLGRQILYCGTEEV